MEEFSDIISAHAERHSDNLSVVITPSTSLQNGRCIFIPCVGDNLTVIDACNACDYRPDINNTGAGNACTIGRSQRLLRDWLSCQYVDLVLQNFRTCWTQICLK